LAIRGSNTRIGRKTILSAGRQVFLQDGYDATIDSVAASAGVTKKTIFNHFGSKEALFEEILLETGAEVPRLTLSTTGSIRENLLDFASRYVAAVTGTSVVIAYKLLRIGVLNSVERLYERQREHNDHLRNMLALYFSDCIARGEMKPFNTKNGAERFMASVLGMARIEVSMGIEPTGEGMAEYIEEAVDGFLDGVRK
jgi:AcrR family transcriptional regulator